MGRRQLLTISTIGALVSLTAVGLGLNTGLVTLSSVAILTFVMYENHHQRSFYFLMPMQKHRSFAVGLGPIPFVMIPEVSPAHVGGLINTLLL